MKKILFAFITLCAVLTLSSCHQGGETPELDNTKLWPAANADGKNGYIGRSGQFVIQPIYDACSYFSCGRALVSVGSDYTYFIDEKGEAVFGSASGQFDSASDFYNGYSVISRGGKCGLVDADLNMAIPTVYAWLGQVADNGLLAAKLGTDDKYGYVNTKGISQIYAQFDYAADFVDGIAVVKAGGKYGAINESGRYVIQPVYSSLLSLGAKRISFRRESTDKTYGLLDLSGAVVVDQTYASISACIEHEQGIFAVRNADGKYGYINANGNVLVEPQFDEAKVYHNGYAWAVTNGIYQIINTKGKSVLTLEANETIIDQHNGLFLKRKSGGANIVFSYIDVKGKEVYSYAVADPDYVEPIVTPDPSTGGETGGDTGGGIVNPGGGLNPGGGGFNPGGRG